MSFDYTVIFVGVCLVPPADWPSGGGALSSGLQLLLKPISSRARLAQSTLRDEIKSV